MRCVHGVPEHKPCPDCQYEYDCELAGKKPENRFPTTPTKPTPPEREEVP